MAHQWLRANLAASLFPLTSDLWGRSIIVPQYDENYERVTVSPNDLGKDKGVPQIYYCHNVMATSNGFQSIGYNEVVSGVVVGSSPFDQVFPLQSSGLNRALFVPAGGDNWILESPTAGWIQASPFAAGTVPGNVLVTTAFVQGQTYIYYANYGCFTFNPGTGNLDSVTLTGLDATDIIGICAADGYMIAYDKTNISWSSQVDPTDFTPSLITGSGSGAVGDAKGAIVVGLPIAKGFMLYCEKNVVACSYTGNNLFPFLDQEVPGSGGVNASSQVAWQGNWDIHYAWTSQGLQAVGLTGDAQFLFSEVSEFLGAKVYEDFDEDTLTFSNIFLPNPLTVQMAIVGNQYLCMSYAPQVNSDFDYSLVYDLSRQRFGKLKLPHIAIANWNTPGNNFDYIYSTLPGSYASLAGNSYASLNQSGAGPEDQVNQTFALVQADGTTYLVDFDFSEATADGVILLGKFQLQRNSMITHQRSDVEGGFLGPNFNLYVSITLDGKTLEGFQEGFPLPTGASNPNPGKMRRYGKRTTGVNYSLLFTGGFNLTTVLTDFTVGGSI